MLTATILKLPQPAMEAELAARKRQGYNNCATLGTVRQICILRLNEAHRAVETAQGVTGGAAHV